MRDTLDVHGIVFTEATPHCRARGLLGFVSCKLGRTLMLDGITIRKTADGHLALSFPQHRDRRGRPHPTVRPLDQAAREAIETQVFDVLRARGDLP